MILKIRCELDSVHRDISTILTEQQKPTSYLAHRMRLLPWIHIRATDLLWLLPPSALAGHPWTLHSCGYLFWTHSASSQLSAELFCVLFSLSPQHPPFSLNKTCILQIAHFCKASVVHNVCYKIWWKIKALVAVWTLGWSQVEGTFRNIVFTRKNEQLLGTNCRYHIPIHNNFQFHIGHHVAMTFLCLRDILKPWSLPRNTAG